MPALLWVQHQPPEFDVYFFPSSHPFFLCHKKWFPREKMSVPRVVVRINQDKIQCLAQGTHFGTFTTIIIIITVSQSNGNWNLAPPTTLLQSRFSLSLIHHAGQKVDHQELRGSCWIGRKDIHFLIWESTSITETVFCLFTTFFGHKPIGF